MPCLVEVPSRRCARSVVGALRMWPARPLASLCAGGRVGSRIRLKVRLAKRRKGRGAPSLQRRYRDRVLHRGLADLLHRHQVPAPSRKVLPCGSCLPSIVPYVPSQRVVYACARGARLCELFAPLPGPRPRGAAALDAAGCRLDRSPPGRSRASTPDDRRAPRPALQGQAGRSKCPEPHTSSCAHVCGRPRAAPNKKATAAASVLSAPRDRDVSVVAPTDAGPRTCTRRPGRRAVVPAVARPRERRRALPPVATYPVRRCKSSRVGILCPHPDDATMLTSTVTARTVGYDGVEQRPAAPCGPRRVGNDDVR